MTIAPSPQTPPSPAALLEENLALRQEIEAARAENQAVWQLLVEMNRRLQSSSAAIKASVSSLLTYDIFWDSTNQHEFLETINTSIDQVGSLANLLALTFRLRAGTLELRFEAQALPEIISAVEDHVARRPTSYNLTVKLPPEGQPVWVDYEYLIVAIEFLMESAGQNGARAIQLEASEAADHWQLDIAGLTPPCLAVIQNLLQRQDVPPPVADALGADYQLRLFLAFNILRCQAVQIEVAAPVGKPSHLRLSIPIPAGR